LLALPLFVSSPAAAVVVPTTQTCKPANLPLTFTIPADWSCEGPEPYGNVARGAKAGGMAPGYVVQLNVFTIRVQSNAPVTGYAPGLAAAVEQQFSRIPGIRVSHSATTIGASVPAVLVTVRLGRSIVRLDYFFVDRGLLYQFEYGGSVLDFGDSAKWMKKDMSAIEASARSIHLISTA
jgi:hypothetical protein